MPTKAKQQCLRDRGRYLKTRSGARKRPAVTTLPTGARNFKASNLTSAQHGPTFHGYTDLPRDIRQMILAAALDPGALREKTRFTIPPDPADAPSFIVSSTAKKNPVAPVLATLNKQAADDMLGIQGVLKWWSPWRADSCIPREAFQLWLSNERQGRKTKRKWEQSCIRCGPHPDSWPYHQLPHSWLHLEWVGTADFREAQSRIIRKKFVFIPTRGGYHLVDAVRDE